MESGHEGLEGWRANSSSEEKCSEASLTGITCLLQCWHVAVAITKVQEKWHMGANVSHQSASLITWHQLLTAHESQGGPGKRSSTPHTGAHTSGRRTAITCAWKSLTGLSSWNAVGLPELATLLVVRSVQREYKNKKTVDSRDLITHTAHAGSGLIRHASAGACACVQPRAGRDNASVEEGTTPMHVTV